MRSDPVFHSVCSYIPKIAESHKILSYMPPTIIDHDRYCSRLVDRDDV